jgi:hypothetical protein
LSPNFLTLLLPAPSSLSTLSSFSPNVTPRLSPSEKLAK